MLSTTHLWIILVTMIAVLMIMLAVPNKIILFHRLCHILHNAIGFEHYNMLDDDDDDDDYEYVG